MKKGTDLELVIFFFAILFLPKIGMLDLKMIAVAVFLGISLTRDRKIGIDGRLLFSVGIILSLIFMFLINSSSRLQITEKEMGTTVQSALWRAAI